MAIYTPRNQIDITNVYTFGHGYGEVGAMLDTLYEVADAEFNSRSDIHSLFQSHKSKTGLRFARALEPHVLTIMKRDGLDGLGVYAYKQVTLKLAQAWVISDTGGKHDR